MTGTIIFITVFHLLFISFFTYAAVSIGSFNERQKELLEQGKPIDGRVIKLKYQHRYLFFFIKTGFSDVNIEFEWKGDLKRMKAVGAVPNDTYKIGDNIELLYLEKHPKTIIIAGTEPLSSKQILITRIVLVIFIIVLTIFAVIGIREKIRHEESRRHVIEFLESQMASEEYSGEYDELIRVFKCD